MCFKELIKTIAVFLLLFSVNKCSFAQGFYFKAGLGYSIPQAGQTLDGTGTPYSGSISHSTSADSLKHTTYSLSKVSFSSGTNATITSGYMFNRNIGVDLSFVFGISNSSYTFNSLNDSIGGIPYNIQIVQKAQNQKLLIPSIVIQTNGNLFNFYSKMGLVIPLNTTIIQDQIFTNLPGSGAIESDNYSWQIKNSFSLGFSASTGAQYKIDENLKIWLELSLLSMSAYAKEADLVSISVNGQGNYISQIPASQRKVTFSDNFTSVSNDYFHQPTYSQPFSNFGINLGIVYILSKEKYSYKSNNKKKYNNEDHINKF